MRSIVTLSLAALLGAVSATAQNYFIPDNLSNVGTCNVIPFGSTSPGAFSNQKYQCKATVADLGAVANVITGLGFAPCSSGACSYDFIEVVIDHHPAGAPLDPTFANNLSGTAVTVLSASNYIWNVQGDQWNEIGLQDLFVFNGVDDIVIQVETVNAIGTGGFHRDTRQRLYWFASSGTPPATGTLGNAALKFEVSMLTAKLSSYGAGCPGSNGTPLHTLTGSAQLGNTINLTIDNGAVSLIAFLVFGVDNSSPAYPFDLGGLGAPGCFQYQDILTVQTVPLDAVGSGAAQLVVPTDPSYVNVRLYSQYACVDPGTNTLGLTTSNYGRILLGN